MTELSETTEKIAKDGSEIHVKKVGESTVSLRRFSSSEKDANAVIQINNKTAEKSGTLPVEIKYFDNRK